jgi:tetratricopeptide (TPR) repeat protein
MNRLGEAESLWRRALDIDERRLDSSHPSIAVRLNNLAGVLKATKRLSEADPLYRRALGINEQSGGEGGDWLN